MVCKKCGNKLDEGVEICRICGEKNTPEIQLVEKKTLKNSTIIVITCIVAVVVLVLGLALIFHEPILDFIENSGNKTEKITNKDNKRKTESKEDQDNGKSPDETTPNQENNATDEKINAEADDAYQKEIDEENQKHKKIIDELNVEYEKYEVDDDLVAAWEQEVSRMEEEVKQTKYTLIRLQSMLDSCKDELAQVQTDLKRMEQDPNADPEEIDQLREREMYFSSLIGSLERDVSMWQGQVDVLQRQLDEAKVALADAKEIQKQKENVELQIKQENQRHEQAIKEINKKYNK